MAEETYWPFKNLDPDDSEFVPRGAACAKISDALGRIGDNNGGLYAFGGGDIALPAPPGLVVRDRRCSKTKDAKKWELPTNQFWLKNPEWNRKIGDLGVEIGKKLGFQYVLLDVILSKLVVYESGGHLDKRNDRDEDLDVVATLVVQLPSLHEGGDLVIYDDEDVEKQYRFDFGKSDGTAAFKPSYAVYVAGAEYALEEVKKGYRVVLVYSIRLSPNEELSGVNLSKRFVQELKEAVMDFGETDETFALLLDNGHEIEGSERLDAVDKGRLLALQKANSLVPREKRLKFYIAKIRHRATIVKCPGDGKDRALYRTYSRIPSRSSYGPQWRAKEQSDSVVWFFTSGEILHTSDWEYTHDTYNWTTKLNFLNPERTAPRTMWSKHICCDQFLAGR